MNNMRLIISLILFLSFLPLNVFSLVMDKAEQIRIENEPYLQENIVFYKKDNVFWMKPFGLMPLKINDSTKSEQIIDFSHLVYNDSVYSAYIELKSQKKDLHLFSLPKNLYKPEYFNLSTNATAIVSNIFHDKSQENTIYILEASTNSTQVKLHKFNTETKDISSVTIQGLVGENIYNLTPIVDRDKIYFCYYSVSNNDKERNLNISIFNKNTLGHIDTKTYENLQGVSFIYGFSTNNTPIFIYKSYTNEKFQLNIVKFKENQWLNKNIKGFDGLDVARIDYHVWDDGKILLVLSAEELYKFKQRIYALTSQDYGETFKVTRIDNKEFDNTRSWLPRLVVLGDNVICVWEDSRDIRSRVYYNISKDRGETWSKNSVALSDSKYYSMRPRISIKDNDIYIAWQQFSDDTRKQADLIFVKTNLYELENKIKSNKQQISHSEKEKKLTLSLKKYWNAMLKNDYRTVYNLHDPFFKASIDFETYKNKTGAIKYHKFNLGEIKIYGNEAFVKINVNYEVKKINLGGKETSLPAKETTIEDTWLYIDNKWHRKYVDPITGGSSINY